MQKFLYFEKRCEIKPKQVFEEKKEISVVLKFLFSQ